MAPGTRGRSSAISSLARPRSILSRSAGSSRTPAKRSGSVRRRPSSTERGAKRVGEGEHLETVEGAGRALGLGIERAQALDGVPEELDAHRRLPIRGEDVEDASAARDLAGRGNGILAAIPALVERFEEDLGREVFAALDRDDARLEQARRRGSAAGVPPARRRGRSAARAWPRARRPPAAARPPDGAAGRGTAPGPGAGRARTAPAAPVSWASVRRSSVTRSTRRSVLTTTSSGRAGDEQRDEKARGAGEPMDGDEAVRGQDPARFRDPGVRGDRTDPGRGEAAGRERGKARRAHVWRMRDTIDVVERPGSSSTRTTRPPPASTSSRPTIASSAQSAPLTRTSGARAAITARGVSSS